MNCYTTIAMEYDPNPPLCIWCADEPKAEGNLCRRCYEQAEAERQEALQSAEEGLIRYSPESIGYALLHEKVQRLRDTDSRQYLLPKHSVLKEVNSE